MQRIILVFISIFVLDTIVMMSCTSKTSSSLSAIADKECLSLNELIVSMWNSPNLTSNVTLSNEQYSSVFSSDARDKYAFISALFDSAKYGRAKTLKTTISDIECKINSLNNPEELTGSDQDNKLEECSNKYICPNCSLETLKNILSEYKERLSGIESCKFDASLIKKEELSMEQDLAVYSTLLVNNSSELNEEFVNVWEEAINHYPYTGLTNDEKGALTTLATFVKDNKHVASQSADGVYRISQIDKVCKQIDKLFTKAKSAENSKVVGFCVNCVSTLVGMCKATLIDTKEYLKSKVLDEDKKVQVYVNNFIRQVVTSVVLCTTKQIFKKTWTTIAKKIKEFVIKGQKKVIFDKENYNPSVKQAILSAICEVGFGVLGDSISMDMDVNYDNPCRSMWNMDKSRWASCSRTVATVCPIFLNSGYVNLSSFLPDTGGNVWLNILYDMGTMGTTFTCQAGGKSIAMLCSTIAAAASQIKSAILTGNNDWAHCLGFDQGGACVGTKWAEYWGGMSLSYAKSPVEKLKKNSYGSYEGDMCMCERNCYEDNIIFDKKYKTETVFSYAGDISNSLTKYNDCRSFNGRKIKHGVPAKAGSKKTYAKYGNCNLVSVSFLNKDDPDAAVPLDGTEVNYRPRNEAGEFVSGSSWKSITSQSYKGCVDN